MKNYDVIILVGSNNLGINTTRDDLLLRDKLISKGYFVKIVDWNSKFDWSSTKLAIIRSTWDYSRKHKEFLEKMLFISKKTTLINSYEILSENHNKNYLKSISSNGVNIIPSLFLSKYDEYLLTNFINDNKCEHIVIKPTISAGGRNTYKVKSVELNNIKKYINECLEISEVIIQPFLESITSKGEISTMTINNEIISSVKKIPKKDNFLVQSHHGGIETNYTLKSSEREFVNKVIEYLPSKALYARIDYIVDDYNKYLVEVEMIEPDLFLRFSDDLLNEFASAIENIIRDMNERNRYSYKKVDLNDADGVLYLMNNTYWGGSRSKEDIKIIIKNSSICIGIYDNENDKLVAYSRSLTDYITTNVIFDVIVDPDYQKQDLGENCLLRLINMDEFKKVEAHELYCKDYNVKFYKKYDFDVYNELFLMRRIKEKR